MSIISFIASCIFFVIALGAAIRVSLISLAFFADFLNRLTGRDRNGKASKHR